MQTKTYIASTKLEALLKMREELGAEAIILGERTVYQGRFFRRKPMVEITVGIQEEPTKRYPEPSEKVEPKGIEAVDPHQTRLRRLEREVGELRTLVQSLYTQLTGREPSEGVLAPQAVVAPEEEHPLLRPLLSVGVEPEIARDLLRRVPRIPQNAAVETLKRIITTRLPVGGVIARHSATRQVVALVGPTGVGKTTTIAKLAAIHALDYGRKVALLSLDTYRIGAVEQLRTYAGILNVPLHIASDADEVQEGLELFQGYDIVFIDTVGRGQRDESHLAQMQRALAPAKAQIYLTLSTTTDTAVLLESAHKFSLFEPQAVILTKLDEAVRLGNCLNLCLHMSLPIAYLTTGQRVPEDIQQADARWLACRILASQGECLSNSRGSLALRYQEEV